jgi:hypothetical protein
MPVSTPNRDAVPINLEAYHYPCIVRQEGGLFLPFFAKGSSIIRGEPYYALGRILITLSHIGANKMGTGLAEWVVDALLDSAHTGNINEGDLIYWDRDLDIVTPQDPVNGTAVVAGIGAASASVPTNGFILGRALSAHEEEPTLDGSGDLLVGATGSKRVRVASVPGAPTVYGTPNAAA